MALNTVDNVEAFMADINNGRWDVVLPQVAHLRLPSAKLYDLYEQVHPLSHLTLPLDSRSHRAAAGATPTLLRWCGLLRVTLTPQRASEHR